MRRNLENAAFECENYCIKQIYFSYKEEKVVELQSGVIGKYFVQDCQPQLNMQG